MTELSLQEFWQSAPAQALLARHREASIRECQDENRHRLFSTIDQIAALTKTMDLSEIPEREPKK
jgi:hypothetical protein